ncbi:MAG: Holliday junction branch migration protein RuvA [Ruminococcus sp.]|nr:Holliday junction branch migration protein RuvA [Ruminococcus sp.]
MIYSVRGKVIFTDSVRAVIECGGVGYECRTTLNTLQAIAGKSEAMLLTHLSVREDAVELFGFATKEEIESFRMLVSVSGVGPKAAISILSSMTPSAFALAVATGDTKAFTNVKGIGAKTAQRISLELKDKIAKDTVSVRGGSAALTVSPIAGNNASEAICALEVLGYSQGEAAAAIGKLDPALSVEDMIKQSLKILSGMR